jgi:pimeloyl-ACP methyl ester carboxylesterase
VPTLVVTGDDDWITPRAQAERVAGAIPGAKLLVVEESGHFPFVEQTERFLAGVRQFLA